MSEIRKIPSVSEINNQKVEKKQNEVTEATKATEEIPLTEEELQEKENLRNQIIKQCRDYVQYYIQNKAPGKITYSANIKGRNNSYIFRYSPPSKRGIKTQNFSQIVYDKEKNDCHFEYFRPEHHDHHLWYFPIWYMMNGFTKNAKRTFQALGIEPVETSLRQTFEQLGYNITYFGNNRIGRVVSVEWTTIATTTQTPIKN